MPKMVDPTPVEGLAVIIATLTGAVVAPHVTGFVVAAGAERGHLVSGELEGDRALSRNPSPWGLSSPQREKTVVDPGLAAEGGERDPDQREQSEYGQDQDQNDPPGGSIRDILDANMVETPSCYRQPIWFD